MAIVIVLVVDFCCCVSNAFCTRETVAARCHCPHPFAPITPDTCVAARSEISNLLCGNIEKTVAGELRKCALNALFVVLKRIFVSLIDPLQLATTA